MKTFFSSLAFLSLTAAATCQGTSPGCDKPLPDSVKVGDSTNITITSKSGYTPRKYTIHIPEEYDTKVAVPLIFSFHGRGKAAWFQEELSQFSNSSYGFKGIVVYPEGIPNENGTKQWQGDPDAPVSINDVTFTLEILDEVLDNYCIDPTKVYAAGKSNGGGFTGSILACNETVTERIAAFAAVSGAFYLNKDQQMPACKPTTQREVIPIMEFHGLKDDTIKYDGDLNTRENANTTNIPEWVNAWAERDGFDSQVNTTERLCKGARNVTKISWDDTVVHYAYRNLYHDWPSTFPNGDTNLTTCKEAEATVVILDWFQKWTL